MSKSQYRPQCHYSPLKYWMNDPNGLVYENGEYHLFYQYHPNGIEWGPMHWGHAVSKDLIYWMELPIALYPDKNGMIFSGSAVVDVHNTTGCSTSHPPIVAIYTYSTEAGQQSQAIAYSFNHGRSWEKYGIVLPNSGEQDFRDPKVSWHEATQQWIMVLAVKDRIKFYSSQNLKAWKYESEFTSQLATDGVWECPDLFPLTLHGTTYWVLIISINPGGPYGGSATFYFTGHFDGKQFNAIDPKLQWIDYGRDNYAGVTWSNVPNDRRLFIGWMSNWEYANKVPTTTWRGTMTIPRELKLFQTKLGIRLGSYPIPEHQKLRKDIVSLPIGALAKPIQLTEVTIPMELQVTMKLNGKRPEAVFIQWRNNVGEVLAVGYSWESSSFFVDRTKSGVAVTPDFPGIHSCRCLIENELKLTILLDTTSIEVFGMDGEAVLTDIVFPTEPYNTMTITGNGTMEIVEGAIYPLKSIWN